MLLPLPLAGVLDYRVAEGLDVAPGDIVLVPLNGRDRVGVVWDGNPAADLPNDRLKSISTIDGRFNIDTSLRQFIDWVAAYTLSPPGVVLAMALRCRALEPERPTLGVRRSSTPVSQTTPGRQRTLATLGESVMSAAQLAQRAGVSASIIRAMLRGGWLETAPLPLCSKAEIHPARCESSPLNLEQHSAAQKLCHAVAERRFRVTLLHGATGSGKTEVYFEAVRACLAEGRQALILLPEIALSAQWLQRFERRFGVASAVWHSDLSPKTRRATWRAAALGQTAVVMGARSALFLPFADLGLIVVDEEHETAFKQEDGVVYHARDMAVVRGRLASAAVVLVSATPSLETIVNVEAGRYQRLDLPHRYGGAVLPAISAIDLRQHPPQRGAFLSPVLLEQIAQTLGRAEQAMLFLNRRGYAPLTLCRACGHRIQCPNCTAWLVEHRLRRVLLCHHCAYTEPVPPGCPACATDGSMTAIGPGVERITEEVRQRFPAARSLVMTSDTVLGPQAASRAAAAVESREVDLIIGTQMVAKGWHFPHLTLVGVVDADLGLAGGDLRASERTVQLLHQVAGRAGRSSAAGTVLLQTYLPEHPVMQALVDGDIARFMQAEAAQRRLGHWPPYGRLAALIVSSSNAEDADAAARTLGRAAPTGPGITVLGPAPAPLALLRGRHRRRLLLRTGRDVAVQPLLRRWLQTANVQRNVRVDVDVDPISFL